MKAKVDTITDVEFGQIIRFFAIDFPVSEKAKLTNIFTHFEITIHDRNGLIIFH